MMAAAPLTHAFPSRFAARLAVLRRKRVQILLKAGALVGAILVLDLLTSDAVPMGWMYLAPMALAATALPRVPLLLLAALCTFLAEFFDGYAWTWAEGITRDALYLSAFAGAALFVHGAVRSREAAQEHLRAVEEQMRAREDAEEQLRVLVEQSPVAVFTADAAGQVLLANEAADRLFALDPGELPGRSFAPFLPVLMELPSWNSAGPAFPPSQGLFRTAMQCRGHRANGEIFQADVWFSTYATTIGPRLAVFVADSSEDLRDREEASLQQLLTGSRILVGAVSHEVRNVCAAIGVVYENLRRSGALGASLIASKDFEALGTLVPALERIASVELREAADQMAALDLRALLEEVQIVIAPALREEEIGLDWELPRTLPPVWADRQSLLQVLLNLVKNSRRALEAAPGERVLRMHIEQRPARVEVHISDTGPGVARPEILFRPFQQQAGGSGLGLYLSRALMRSFGGELRHLPTAAGATFVAELAPASLKDFH